MSTSVARILVIGADKNQLDELCATLQTAGYAAMGFSAPGAASLALSQQSFKLMLMDLPEIGSSAWLQTASEIDPTMPRILLLPASENPDTIKPAGAIDFLFKPFTPFILLSTLERSLAIQSLRIENKKLERDVHERTLELRAANRELDVFAHAVSHDLRAPLRALDGFTNILVDQYSAVLDETGQGYLQRITDAADRMRSLIDDLLRLSHITGTELNRQRLDLSQLAHAVVDELKNADANRNVTVRIGSNLSAHADARLMRLVLENLIGNAWKFTKNVVHAQIELDLEDAASGTYFIKDNGAGFKQEYAEKLFVPFRRLHTPAEFPGVGMGLAIVQRILRRHGGSIRAEGAVGQGAIFRFTLNDDVPLAAT